MRFFVGLHQPGDAVHFDAAFISVNRLRRLRFPGRRQLGDWIMDSGAFTEIVAHGNYRTTAAEYAAEVRRWAGAGRLLAAVSQDWMCEPWIVRRTGLSVAEHQARTIQRYDAIRDCDTGGVYVMPVLQGYAPPDYLSHLGQYGARLPLDAWVGVGSVCKRNGDPEAIERVLAGIKAARPDLRLHGFGLKTSALSSAPVRSLLHSADSMAWSFNARRNGRSPNSWLAAKDWCDRLPADCRPVSKTYPDLQLPIPGVSGFEPPASR